MHPEPPQHDAARDPILDGRDSLRLVKLRLALTLVTVAILPVAAVAPMVRAVADQARVAHHLRLAAQAGQVSAALQQQLDAIAGATDQLAADPAVVASLGSNAAAKRVAAVARLDQVLSPRAGVTRADVVSGSAVAATWGSGPAASGTLSDGYSLVASTADGQPTLASVASIAGKGHGQVVVLVSLPALVGLSMPDPPLPGESVAVLDRSGQPIAVEAPSFDAAAIPGQVLDLATEAARDTEGLHGLAVPGLDGWTISVSAPIPLAELPMPAIAALGGVILVLIGFTLWMARQILRPAAQLEASRSRLRDLYESAREAALRDSLTGLGNHRSFQEAVAQMVEGSRRYGTMFSLILLDIDEFKRINDTRGHAVGDQLLSQFGDLIRNTIRQTDAGFRVGGDEFAILLPHTDALGAVGLCRRLLARSLEDRASAAYRGPVSFSAGVTACPEFGATRLELTAQADAALYRGKRAGRTLVTIYDPSVDHGHVDEGMRAELSSAVSAIIEGASLTPAYQPIVDLGNGRIVGYEGLVRLPRDSTFPHTGALFDAAEAAGRVAELDRAALDVVLDGAKGLAEDVGISLNVSPQTLESGELSPTAFLATLRRHRVAARRVILELTEREAVRDPERLREALVAIQRADVRIAADDVGAGNAGLRLLSQFQFDVVKIDLSLVQGGASAAGGADQTRSVLESLVEMAGRLGALTIAEGVETPDQLRTIRELGIAAGQGYLLGRPGPRHDATWVDLEALSNPEPVAPEPQAPDRPPGDPLRRPMTRPATRATEPTAIVTRAEADLAPTTAAGRDRAKATLRRSLKFVRASRGRDA